MVNTFAGKKLQPAILFLFIPFILWLSTAYTIFKKPQQGYVALKTIAAGIKKDSSFHANTFFFLNNDTKTHFALINQFDTGKQFINLDTIQKGFKPFVAYQPQPVLKGPNSLQKGWLIVSDDYGENLEPNSIKLIKALLAQQMYTHKAGSTMAYPVNSGQLLRRVMEIVNVKNADAGCK
jgi:hypothetical protein